MTGKPPEIPEHFVRFDDLKREAAPDIVRTYANEVQVAVSTSDVRLVFGRADMRSTPEQSRMIEVADIMIPPLAAIQLFATLGHRLHELNRVRTHADSVVDQVLKMFAPKDVAPPQNASVTKTENEI